MKLLLPLIIIFIILGCSTSSLSFKNNTINIKQNNLSLSFTGKHLSTSQINLGSISILQEEVKTDFNDILVYEYARVNTGYAFKSHYTYILTQIFDATNVELKKEEIGLGFFVITLRNKEKVYALVKTSSKKYLSMVYGFSKENFEFLLEGKNVQTSQEKMAYEDKTIKTVWSNKLIITGVLLQRQGSLHF